MQISIINVANQTVPTSKGSYQALEVTYKEVAGGKVASRKIMSFVNDSKPAFEALSSASNGEVFTISMVKQPGKDGKDYWVWTNATKGAANATGSTVSPVPTTGGATQAKGNWETTEERAKKQVYIIRQSSLSTAVAALSVGSKAAPKDTDILALAKKFEDYVFDGLTGNIVADTAKLEEDFFQDLPQ